MVYMITYDLDSPGQKYTQLIEEIKKCSTGVWCSYWKSSYMIKSNLTPDQIVERLKPHLDTNDALIAIEVTRNYQGWLKKDNWDYIRRMFD